MACPSTPSFLLPYAAQPHRAYGWVWEGMALPSTPSFLLPYAAQPHRAYHDDIVVPSDLQKNTLSPYEFNGRCGGLVPPQNVSSPPQAAAPDVQVQRIALEACHRRRR